MTDELNFYFIKRAENDEEANNQLKVIAKEFGDFAKLIDECVTGKQDRDQFQENCKRNADRLFDNFDKFYDGNGKWAGYFGDLLGLLGSCYSDAIYLVDEVKHVELDKKLNTF